MVLQCQAPLCSLLRDVDNLLCDHAILPQDLVVAVHLVTFWLDGWVGWPM